MPFPGRAGRRGLRPRGISPSAGPAYLTATGSPERDVAASRAEAEGSFYRPRLTMMVIDFSTAVDEWGATTSWSCKLEER